MLSLAAFALTLAQGWNNGWKVWTGQRAPTIEAAHWFNAGDRVPALEEVRGKVVLLEFFVCSSQACLQRAELLSRLQAQYYDLGLRVIGITTDAPAVVEEQLIAGRHATYWVGSDPAGKTVELYRTDRGPPLPPGKRATVGVPHALVIDGRGMVVEEELPSEARIEELLEDCYNLAGLPELRPELAPARDLYARRSFSLAHKAAAALASASDPAVADDARTLERAIESYADLLQSLSDLSVKRGLPGRAYGFALVLVQRFAGLPQAEAARAKLRQLREDPGVRRDYAAWRAFEEALQHDRSLKTWKAAAVAQRYERVRRDYPDTFAARFAQAERARLADLGAPDRAK
jgi:peroxiredoxin